MRESKTIHTGWVPHRGLMGPGEPHLPLELQRSGARQPSLSSFFRDKMESRTQEEG